MNIGRRVSVVCAFGFLLVSLASGQIQSTISCPQGQGDWDVLSVMMMDPGLASNFHMEGLTNGLPSAYVYTVWDQSRSKIYYIKNPQGNPWDINLYDSNFIYQWVTEVQSYNGVDHWNDPGSCKKFNSGSQNSNADLSMRWAARCAVPGASSFWNPPPTTQPNNTNYYTYIDQKLQSSPQNLSYSKLKLRNTTTITLTDHRSNAPEKFTATSLPLEYDYGCTTQNINSCNSREVFEYALDSGVNPVDRVKHSYGWVRWTYYVNKTGGNPALPAVWSQKNTSASDQLMTGAVSPNFQCF